jgi:two-component system response regulator ResD
MKILLVEDEFKMRIMIKEYLSIEGYEYVEAANGKEGIRCFGEDTFDLVLLDVMMPEIDGWSVCRAIRETSEVPIIMLTARGEEYDRLFGFELGVDDYLVKPFSPKELMARIRAILKRNGKKIVTENIEYQGLKIDIAGRSVLIDGKPVKITPKEYELLLFLMSNKNRALSRQQILDGVWGYDFFGDDRTVDTHIKMLRESIKPYNHLIVTVWGVGYKIELGEA